MEWSVAVPYPQGNYIYSAFSINVSTERLNWRQMLQQMQESTLRQTLQVCISVYENSWDYAGHFVRRKSVLRRTL